MRGGGAGEDRAMRKQEPYTRRASATRAVRAMWKRAGLEARAAPRREARVGQVRATVSESTRSSWVSRREKSMPGSVGSPLVATGRVVMLFHGAPVPGRAGAQGCGEGKIGRLDRSPPVVSGGGEEKRILGEAVGSPSVAGASWTAGSQKATSTPLAALEMGRFGAKVRHSVLQAAVRTSPFQQAGMRAPAGVQPGHWQASACSRMGHSKLRWWRPWKATLTAHVQPVPLMGAGKPMSVPTMRVEMGRQRKGGAQAGGAGRGGAAGSGA